MNHKSTHSKGQAHCCETLLIPLLQRIESIQRRLTEQVERREHDYNEMLRMIILRSLQREGSQPLINNRQSKVKERNHLNTHVAPAQKQSIKFVLNRRKNSKIIKMSREQQQNQQKIQIVQEDSVTAIKAKTTAIQNILNCHQYQLNKHQNDLVKIKELNDYLMDQLLSLFQRMKNQHTGMEIKQQKQLQSLQTVTSIVIQQGNNLQDRNIDKRNSAYVKSHSRQISELNAKIIEHENVLTELIQLTRSLSTQIRLDDSNQSPSSYSYH